MKKTFVLVMPISGPKIANQISGLLFAVKNGYSPDVIFGSSGGCITGTMAISCGISKVKDEDSFDEFRFAIRDILNEISSANYSRPWCEIRPINTIMGIGKGSQFDRGTGAVFLDQDNIDLSNEPELWMGTFNKSIGDAAFFCTKSEKDTKLKLAGGRYLNDDISKIVDIATASSAIPGMVPKVLFEGNYYQDGGVRYASPLGHWLKHFDKTDISYHVLYISPIDFNLNEDPNEDDDEFCQDDDIRNFIRAKAHSMLTGWHVPDRNNGIRHVFCEARKRGLKTVTRTSGKGEEVLKEALKIQKAAEVSFIEVAPITPILVDFLKMRKGDLTKAVRKSYAGNFTVRHWYF